MALLLKWLPKNNLELFEKCGLDGALKERVEGWNTELRSLSTSKFLQLHEAVCAEILEANQSVAIYAQASDRRDQGPSPVGVTDDYAQQMEDTSQLDRLPPEWIQCLDWRSVWSLFVCGRTTAL